MIKFTQAAVAALLTTLNTGVVSANLVGHRSLQGGGAGAVGSDVGADFFSKTAAPTKSPTTRCFTTPFIAAGTMSDRISRDGFISTCNGGGTYCAAAKAFPGTFNSTDQLSYMELGPFALSMTNLVSFR
jgi:hypothetical protein